MGFLAAYSLISFITCLWINLCYASDVSYADHCASMVPESTQLAKRNMDPLPGFPYIQDGFFRGGNDILGPSSSGSSIRMNFLTFLDPRMATTDIAGLFKLEIDLKLRSSSILLTSVKYSNGYKRAEPDPVSLGLTGFWSETSGKLCMVGTGTGLDKGGKTLFLSVVLKLNYPHSCTITNSLITGTLESISSTGDRNYFELISILAFSHLNYVYTLSSRELDHVEVAASDYGLLNHDTNRPLISLPGGSLCYMLSRTPNLFLLKYTNSCKLTRNCSSFTGIELQSLSLMSFDKFSCDENNTRFRAVISFHNNVEFYRADNLKASLIAEGVWDAVKNQLVFKACRFYNTTGSLADVSVGDCSIRLSWRFPAVWSIKSSSAVLGRIWSTKQAQDMDYFSEFSFESNDIRMAGVEGLKYEYTQLDKMRSHCSDDKKSIAYFAKYPNGYSSDMKFGIFAKSSESRFALGVSQPLFVNDFHYEYLGFLDENKLSGAAAEVQNISYRISLAVIAGVALPEGLVSLFSTFNGQMVAQISAEGRYDTATGRMCMIGCRRVPPGSNGVADCEILVKFQFPTFGVSNTSAGYIKGSIDSLRNRSDPLYFDHLDLLSSSFVSDVAGRQVASSKSKMGILVLSKVLTSFFVLVQLHHVSKKPKVLPFISTTMLTILALDLFILPLVSSLKLLVTSHPTLSTLQGMAGWHHVESSEILTAVASFIGLLLLLRLLYLNVLSRWSSQMESKEKEELWAAEGKSLLSALLCFIIGALIISTVRLTKDENLQPSAMLHDLQILLDLFLVPQAFFNIFSNSNSNSNPLSHYFYIGTTFATQIRYFSHSSIIESFPDPHQKVFIFACVFTACLSLVSAVIIYLQQLFGGRCILVLLPFCKSRAETKSVEATVTSIELAA